MILLNETLNAEEIQELVAGLNPAHLPSFLVRRTAYLENSGPAIYFLFYKDRIVYIGETGEVRSRWLSHALRRVPKLKNSPVTYLRVRCDAGTRRKTENRFIDRYEPTINRNPTLQVRF